VPGGVSVAACGPPPRLRVSVPPPARRLADCIQDGDDLGDGRRNAGVRCEVVAQHTNLGSTERAPSDESTGRMAEPASMLALNRTRSYRAAGFPASEQLISENLGCVREAK